MKVTIDIDTRRGEAVLEVIRKKRYTAFYVARRKPYLHMMRNNQSGSHEWQWPKVSSPRPATPNPYATDKGD